MKIIEAIPSGVASLWCTLKSPEESLLRLLADVSQDTTVDIEDVAVDGVGSVRCQEHSGSTKL